MITGTGAPKELDRLLPTAMTLVIRFANIYLHPTCPETRQCRPFASVDPRRETRIGRVGHVRPSGHHIIAPRNVAYIRPRAIVRAAIAERASLRLAPFFSGTFSFSA